MWVNEQGKDVRVHIYIHIYQLHEFYVGQLSTYLKFGPVFEVLSCFRYIKPHHYRHKHKIQDEEYLQEDIDEILENIFLNVVGH